MHTTRFATGCSLKRLLTRSAAGLMVAGVLAAGMVSGAHPVAAAPEEVDERRSDAGIHQTGRFWRR